MPAKNHLNPQQIEKLQKALIEEEKANIRERILILLLLNDGKIQSKIAEFLGCSVNKVSYWCVKADPDNLESLIDERMKGNHKKATDKYIATVAVGCVATLKLSKKATISQRRTLQTHNCCKILENWY